MIGVEETIVVGDVSVYITSRGGRYDLVWKQGEDLPSYDVGEATANKARGLVGKEMRLIVSERRGGLGYQQAVAA